MAESMVPPLYPHPPINCTQLASLNTPLNTNTVEWCPIESHSNLLLCGTYTLQSGLNRAGNIELYGVTNGSLVLYNRYDEGAGVLDLKWLSTNSFGNIFSAVNSIGQLSLYSMTTNETCRVNRMQCAQVCDRSDGSELCLSVDWVNCKEMSIILSDSLGRLAFMVCCDTGELVCSSQWKAHEYEAWVTARDHWNVHLVYSGGDDNKLRGWDLRMPNSSVFTSHHHATGVCSVQSHPLREFLLATGSFDETLFIWDTRNMTAPLRKVLIDDGGFWRLKWHPSDPNLLLAACTRAGAAVFDFTVSLSMPSVTWYREHQSLVYGVDWRKEYTDSDTGVNQILSQFSGICMSDVSKQTECRKKTPCYQIASSSFYDRSLQLWSIDRYSY